MITPYNNSIISPTAQNRIQTENTPDDSSRRILGQRREPNVPNNTPNTIENATNVQKTNNYNDLFLNSSRQSNSEASSFNRGSALDITA